MIGARIVTSLPALVLRLFGWYSVKAFGARGDGVTDDVAAFERALAAMGPVGEPRGATLVIPRGVYRLSRPLRVLRSVVIQGAGGAGDFPATKLLFDAGSHGIVLEGPGTSGAANADGIGTPTLPGGTARADWTTIRDLAVVAAGKTTAGRVGILARVRPIIERVLVDSFSGDGIRMDGDLLATAGQTCNLWKVTDTRVWGCLNGFHVIGADGNCGVARGLDCTMNAEYGVFDESSLGNTYLGCHFENNIFGWARNRNPSARSTFVGCYVESHPTNDSPKGFFSGATVIFGYEGAPQFFADPENPTIPPAVFAREISGAYFKTGAQEIFPMPYAGDLLGFKGEGAANYLLLSRRDTGAGAGTYEFSPKAAPAEVSLRIPDEEAPADVRGRAWLPGGVVLGDGTGRRVVGVGNVKPTHAGNNGDYWINSDYNFGGSIVAGWRNAGGSTWTDDVQFLRMPAQANSAAGTLAALVTDFNALLAKLRAANMLTP